jgi:hypothetical protein
VLSFISINLFFYALYLLKKISFFSIQALCQTLSIHSCPCFFRHMSVNMDKQRHNHDKAPESKQDNPCNSPGLCIFESEPPPQDNRKKQACDQKWRRNRNSISYPIGSLKIKYANQLAWDFCGSPTGCRNARKPIARRGKTSRAIANQLIFFTAVFSIPDIQFHISYSIRSLNRGFISRLNETAEAQDWNYHIPDILPLNL